MEKTLAIHLAEQRDAIARHIEGMTFIVDSFSAPTITMKRIQEVITQEIRNPSDNWA